MKWFKSKSPQLLSFILITAQQIHCQHPLFAGWTFTPCASFKLTPKSAKTICLQIQHFVSNTILWQSPAPFKKNCKTSAIYCFIVLAKAFVTPVLLAYSFQSRGKLFVSYLCNECYDRLLCIFNVFLFDALRYIHGDIDVKCSIFWNPDFSLPLSIIWKNQHLIPVCAVGLHILCHIYFNKKKKYEGRKDNVFWILHRF